MAAQDRHPCSGARLATVNRPIQKHGEVDKGGAEAASATSAQVSTDLGEGRWPLGTGRTWNVASCPLEGLTPDYRQTLTITKPYSMADVGKALRALDL